MDRINAQFLSIFAKNDRFTKTANSLRRRFQTLSLIYLTIVIIVLMLIYTAIVGCFFKFINPFMMIFWCFPFLFINFYWIRKKKLDIAATCLVIALHLSNKVVSDYFNHPFMCIFGSLFYPYFFLFVTSSMKILLLNSALCIGNYFYNFAAVMKIFEVTLNQEQSDEIFASVYICLFLIVSSCFISISQKMMESNVWKLAHENYQKSEKLTQDLIQAMQTKDAFISMVSHEIRNPLNSMKGSVEYLMQVLKDRQHIQILRNAKLSSEILLNLVNNVLDAAKLKSDKMEISRTEIDLLDIIKKTFTINSEIARDKNLRLKAFVDERLPRLLWLDPSRMLQILMNLISNAMKFTPNGGRIELYVSWCPFELNHEELLTPFVNIKGSPKPVLNTSESTVVLQEMNSFDTLTFNRNINFLAISSRKNSNNFDPDPFVEPWSIQKKTFNSNTTDPSSLEKGCLKIQVLDNGSGISESDIPRLFGMFEQAAEHSRSVHGGSGLGLWICKQLCQKMNGDIIVQSEHGKGTSFLFYLPVTSKPNKAPQINQTGPKRQQRVLVVDDYPINRYLHSLLLEQQGVKVTVASNGREAFDIFKKQGDSPFSFVLMDVQMPIMDGFTSVKLIREWEAAEKRAPTDIYFVTGEYFNEEEVLKSFRNQGGSISRIKCLQKPIDKDILRNIVNSS